ncbi:MAG: hypothetical protein ACE5JP_04200 [Candidatus Bipolaricaulia bacterium]
MGALARLIHERAAHQWYYADRIAWQRARRHGDPARLSEANSFIQVAIYNTRNHNPELYTTIAQRHDYYDFISYILEHDPNTTEANRDVRFFHAAAIVTASPGVGTAETIVGAVVLSDDSRRMLTEMSVVLFGYNMRVINNLLFEWQEPRNPLQVGSTERISALDFDLKMVEVEQSIVEDYLKRNRASLTPQVVREINLTLNPTRSWLLRDPQEFRWAMTAVGGPLDFTIQAHRIAIGKALVFMFHGRSMQTYLDYMRTVEQKSGHLLVCM